MLPSLNAVTVKLPAWSKLPGVELGPSNEPPGPLPGTLCHSMGERDAVLDEHAARRTERRRTGNGRTRVIWDPGRSCRAVKGRPERPLVRPLVAAAAATAARI